MLTFRVDNFFQTFSEDRAVLNLQTGLIRLNSFGVSPETMKRCTFTRVTLRPSRVHFYALHAFCDSVPDDREHYRMAYLLRVLKGASPLPLPRLRGATVGPENEVGGVELESLGEEVDGFVVVLGLERLVSLVLERVGHVRREKRMDYGSEYRCREIDPRNPQSSTFIIFTASSCSPPRRFEKFPVKMSLLGRSPTSYQSAFRLIVRKDG